ncbi:MAG: hypothetical protein KO254_03410, partial [Methanoculleus marisnigri]|nr:hypothetical protein [Methanoculleus marisnigri]
MATVRRMRLPERQELEKMRSIFEWRLSVGCDCRNGRSSRRCEASSNATGQRAGAWAPEV